MSDRAFSGTNTKELESQNNGSGSSWLEAYDGNGAAVVTDVTSGDWTIGAFISSSNKQVRTLYLNFDTSSIPDDEVALRATLELTRALSGGTSDWSSRDMEIYAVSYGTPPATTADWLDRSELAAATLVGRVTMDNTWTLGETKVITLSVAAPAGWVSLTGNTQLVLTSEMHSSGETLPADPDYFFNLDNAAGVELVVTSVTAGTLVTTGPMAGTEVCLALFDDALEPAPYWYDIADDIYATNINRGRDDEFDSWQAGTARLVAKNVNGKYDPLNTTSDLYGYILPRKQARIARTNAPTTTDSFTRANSTTTLGTATTGEVWEVLFSYGTWGISTNRAYLPTNGGGHNIATIESRAEDAVVKFTVQTATEAQTGQGLVFRYVNTRNYWYIVFDSAANTWALKKVVDSTHTTVATYSGTGNNGDIISVDCEGSTIIVKVNGSTIGTATGQTDNILGTRHGLYASSAVTSSAFWDSFEIDPYRIVLFRGYIQRQDGWEFYYDKPNDARVVINCVDGFEVLAGVKVDATADADSDGEPDPSYGGEYSGARINRILDLALIPDGWRAVDVGVTLLSDTTLGDNALGLCQEVESIEGGSFFIGANGQFTFKSRHAPLLEPRMTTSQATLSDNGSTSVLEYVEIGRAYAQNIRNYIRAAPSTGSTQVAESTSSQDDYGIITLDVNVLGDEIEALGASQWYLALFKDALFAPSGVQQAPRSSTKLRNRVLRTELLDRETLGFLAPGTTVRSTAAVIIQGITHNLGVDDWMFEKKYTPDRYTFTTYSDYLVLNSTARGKLNTNRLAY